MRNSSDDIKTRMETVSICWNDSIPVWVTENNKEATTGGRHFQAALEFTCLYLDYKESSVMEHFRVEDLHFLLVRLTKILILWLRT